MKNVESEVTFLVRMVMDISYFRKEFDGTDKLSRM